jgi:16S rRNA G966 N2-methylase RsmD
MTHKIIEPLQSLAVPVANVIEGPGNPRRGDVEAIARSYRIFGQRKPLVGRQTGTDENGEPVGYVEAGNHGLKAVRDELGWSHVAVAWIDEDETTAKAYALADNRTSDLGDYDKELLLLQLQDVADAASEELLSATAYTLDDLGALLRELGMLPDEASEVETEAIEWGIYELDEVVRLAMQHYRAVGLPLRTLTVFECMQEINALAALEGHKLVESTLGYGVADTYHPHRFDAKVEGRPTIRDVFEQDRYLDYGLRLIVSQGKRINDQTVLSIFPYVRGAQVASNFRPGYALSMLRRFAFDGASVLDTSTGYGGRLVAFLASTCGEYLGIDPNTETHAANERMADDLGASDRVVLFNQPAEDVTYAQVGAVDFCFTSPPYFAKERYSDEDTQSCNRYRDGADWRKGFLVPTIELQYQCLKPDRFAVINIADVKIQSVTYPLVQWTIDAATAAGFELVRQEHFPLGGRVPGSGEKREAAEPVLVFRKS